MQQPFDEFYAQWHDPVRVHLRSKGIDPPIQDDVLQSIFLRLWKRLPQYDENRGTLPTFIWNNVQYETMQWLRFLARERLHYIWPYVHEVPVTKLMPDVVVNEDNVLSAQLDASEDGRVVEESYYSVIECNETVSSVRAQLANLPERIKDGCVTMFDAIMRRIATGEPASMSDLGRELCISRTAATKKYEMLMNTEVMKDFRTDLLAA